MKKNISYFLTAVLLAVTLISCNPDKLPEVITSEVLNEGIEESVTETPSFELEGTNIASELSYKSWIMVKGETRDSFEDKVEVTLTNTFNNTNTVITVDDFNLGDYTTQLSHKTRKSREDGFVYIIDSTLIYTVSFEDFSFNYEIDYEVATYDDGYTKQLLPYHHLGIIRDKGVMGYQDLDFVIEEGDAVYLRKLLTHSISVEFLGKTYNMTAKVELRKFVGQHPCVVKSEPLSSTITTIGEIIESEFVVRRTWSDGKVEQEPIVCYFGAYIDCQNYAYKVIKGYKNDLAIVSSGFSPDVVSEPRSTNAKYVTCSRYYQKWCVNYNYFDIAIEFIHDEAVYDDGILKCYMPGAAQFTDIVNATPEMRAFGTGEDEEGKYTVYQFKQDVSAKVDGFTLTGWGAMEITAYE